MAIGTIEPRGEVLTLPRGGYLVNTSVGKVQFGAPPETIKDTMGTSGGVPRIFVLPNKLFNWQKGINVGDMEFPIYYNYFLKKRKTFIVCSRAQGKQLLAAMQEAVFGPKELDISGDFHDPVLAADIQPEMDYFRSGLSFQDLIGFCYFEDDEYHIKEVVIKRNQDDSFSVIDSEIEIAAVPGTVAYQPKYDIGERLAEPYKPPLFGVTCLGPSHGFDPKENTSGFIVWLNHTGIMIDPPVDSTEWLQDSNVNPKLIDSIILTHCHADHDAGTFQKILEEGKITLYATKTVMNSFLRKYAALSGESENNLKQLFQFQPIAIGRPLFIHGGEFRFQYRLHSIPTVGFTLRFQDQTFVYSSDHQGDPEVQRKLRDDGIIEASRFRELDEFAWEADVIYHESGIPPLHTPIAFLNNLAQGIQDRIVVYHIAKKDFPDKTNLTLASFGIENTLYYEASAPEYEETYQILNTLKHLDFFDTLPLQKVQSFVTIIEKEHYALEDIIIRRGQTGDKFYIVASGNVAVKAEGLVSDKVLGVHEYFGEIALMTGRPRAADIVAATDVDLYTIGKNEFLSFIAGTEFERILERLIRNRSEDRWNILVSSPFFAPLTTFQKTWLESILEPFELNGSGVLVEEGASLENIYIIRDGIVAVKEKDRDVSTLGRGDFIGSMQKLARDEPAKYTFVYEDSIKLFKIDGKDVRDFIGMNPGLGMKLEYDF